MATRLYPQTEDKSILEKLANVAPGTHRKLDAIQEKFSERKTVLNAEFQSASEDRQNEIRNEFSRMDSQEHNAIHDNSDTERLNHFINFGWGRLSGEGCDLIEANRMDSSIGATDDLKLAKQLVELQEIRLPEEVDFNTIGGVSWS